jgi:Ala-tRNA(Pro) deacylase
MIGNGGAIMPIRPAIRDWLELVHAPYRALSHQPAFTAQEEAAEAHVSGRDWAKTVVCFADEQPVLAVLPASLIIDFEKLRTLIGARRLRLASEEEMARLYPDCEVGAVPPLGPMYKQRVFVETRLSKESDIVFSAGTHMDAIQMPYAAFAAAARPVVGDYGELPGTRKPDEHDGIGLWT